MRYSLSGGTIVTARNAVSTPCGLEGGGRGIPALQSQAGVTYVPCHGDRTRLYWIGWRAWLCAEAAALSGAASAVLGGVLELPQGLSAFSRERPGSARVTVEGPSR